jgi:hypothetical protein
VTGRDILHFQQDRLALATGSDSYLLAPKRKYLWQITFSGLFRSTGLWLAN